MLKMSDVDRDEGDESSESEDKNSDSITGVHNDEGSYGEY